MTVLTGIQFSKWKMILKQIIVILFIKYYITYIIYLNGVKN